ncbi:MAG: amidohydrolase, partial [Candidatus Latescibacteria bacterium]|nr:amidohydrolase [Candidatus Latescibacterota bacterium]
MKIDIFNHFFPARFYEKVMAVAPEHKDLGKRVRNIPCLVDLDVRFKIMDEFGAYCQLLSLPGPPTEVFAGPDVSPELARIGNDGLAELVAKYPDRFPGFIASLPMNNPEAAVA